MLCTCPRDKLCDRCLEAGFAQLGGTAANRGERWAAELREKGGAAPTGDALDVELALMLAIGRVADLTEDERLQARLAREVVRWLSPAMPAAIDQRR